MKYSIQEQCKTCNKLVDGYSDESHVSLNFVCDSCTNKEKFKDLGSVTYDGAPRGYVRGSQTPCRN